MPESNSSTMHSSSRSRNSSIQILAVIVIVLLLLISVYNLVQISALQNELRSLESQNAFQQSQLANVQQQLNGVESELSSLTQGPTSSGKFAVKATYACVSVYDQQKCGGTFVYLIGLTNIGTRTIPKDYSVFLVFKDSTSGAAFGFNTTMVRSLDPGQSGSLNATAWPQGTNATSKLSPGDDLGIGISVGDFETGISIKVLSCVVTGTTTTTLLNYTQTQTRTETLQTCS